MLQDVFMMSNRLRAGIPDNVHDTGLFATFGNHP